jgi:hypothetical protein
MRKPMRNTDAALTEASDCLWDDPQRSLELCNRYLEQYPEHPHGLFSRHQAWKRLGRSSIANLAIMNGLSKI